MSNQETQQPTQTQQPTHFIIIPYRDRENERLEFNSKMVEYFNKDICARQNGSWEIWYIEQSDTKLFNRGALCNIGALEVKHRLHGLTENELNKITLIFHDVDIIINEPDLIKYECNEGEIRHPYGEIDARKGPMLGCFCIIRLGDFLKTGGFPNYYGWGLEDVALGHRCLATGIKINETGLIPRYSHNGIKDAISHSDPAKIKFIRACHNRNLAEFRTENQAQPRNTYKSLKYKIVNEIWNDTLGHQNKILGLSCEFFVM